MGRLRSRWTVVALVPAFFLTGFALVSALAGSDDDVPAAATGVPPASTGAQADPDVATGAEEGGEAVDGDGTATTGEEGAGTTSGEPGGGQAAPRTAPPPGAIEIDFGGWADWFAIEDAEIVPEFGRATVTGAFRYLGGADCLVGYVELAGRFFDGEGRAVGRGRWESIWATGEGAEVPQREPLPLEFSGEVGEEPASASIRFVRVDCL